MGLLYEPKISANLAGGKIGEKCEVNAKNGVIAPSQAFIIDRFHPEATCK